MSQQKAAEITYNGELWPKVFLIVFRSLACLLTCINANQLSKGTANLHKYSPTPIFTV
jgi:hypothetical protein